MRIMVHQQIERWKDEGITPEDARLALGMRKPVSGWGAVEIFMLAWTTANGDAACRFADYEPIVISAR